MDVNEMIEQKNLFVEHTELNKFVITVPSIWSIRMNLVEKSDP